MDTFYSSIIEAKDKNLIPICKNFKTGQEFSLHSKYNPIREAEQFASQVTFANFFLVLGLAGGYHIQKLNEKFPKSKIFAVEISNEAIDFLFQIPEVKNALQNKNIHISTIEHLEHDLLSFYKPAIHGNLSILSLKSWETIFSDEAALAREKIRKTLKLLAADFSVQSHFGKMWQKNILINLSLAEKISTNMEKISSLASLDRNDKNTIVVQKGKIAAIIAAGPSLDDSISELKQNRENYFIIATDTAFSALTKQGIKSDVVISIDGQMVSHEHFLENFPEKTIFAFDLCAASSSVRKALKFHRDVIFFETGHPLSQYASFFNGGHNFPHLEAGSGTVTIAAASFAQSLGFQTEKIKFFGADFSYIGGKPYARGTYLESKFYSTSTRLNTAENFYTKLMNRTPVRQISENKITTEILEAYKNSLCDFMNRDSTEANKNLQNLTPFDFQKFKSLYCKELNKTFRSETDFDESTNAFTTLLPLIAKVGKDSAFLAYLKILEYTERI